MLNLTDADKMHLRQAALSQACHDDRGEVPQEDTLRRAAAYYAFLVGEVWESVD